MNHKDFLQRVFTSEDARIMSQPVLVALSGGADSVALLRLLLDAGCRCYAAHCNFHLRGEESMRDERFVRKLCNRLDVPLIVNDFDVAAYQREHGGSVEMACRELRYTWFEQERERQGCAVIAVAHHADDQVETFFLNLLRGTGIKGLAGMERLNGNIWRPLLSVSRQDILDYLSAIGQDYVTDSTNAQNDYRRNRLRNIVLPIIEQQFPQSQERILDTIGNLKQDHDLLMSIVNNAIPDERHIDIPRLLSQPQASTLLYHRLRHLGFNRSQCEQAVTAARQSHSGRQFAAPNHIMHLNRQTIDIEPIGRQPDIAIPIDLTADVLSPVNISISRNNPPFSPRMCDGKGKVAFDIKLLDCQRIVLRRWRRGDRIKPYGLKGSKLVSDLFADLKLDHRAKRDTWLLEADGDILWVLGYRASALYAVQRESQDYLLLHLEK
ncbi:MAG: tRNA lysidine(34) synthetase TilS [Muribaculaceae bacterium]|nr:tRNA lysidine(34) synthetase TilS [Muribaculaceae bacterium]